LHFHLTLRNLCAFHEESEFAVLSGFLSNKIIAEILNKKQKLKKGLFLGFGYTFALQTQGARKRFLLCY